MPVDESSNKKRQEIPEAVIKRLPVYHRHLTQLAKQEKEKISSPELAAKIGITASQLRQDLSWFGSFGQQGVGYRVNELLHEITQILGLENEIHMIMVGAGHLGRAIASYPSFNEKGFHIKAIFDNNPAIIGDVIEGNAIQSATELSNYLERSKVTVGVISTPANAAQEVADILVKGGVKGIWNFAPQILKVPSDVVVEHVHISESLMMLSFKLRQQNREKWKNPVN
jgi:redox-sensing transcriptional repressor